MYDWSQNAKQNKQSASGPVGGVGDTKTLEKVALARDPHIVGEAEARPACPLLRVQYI